MNLGAQRFALYCGIAFPFIFFVFWGLIGGFMLPLPSPGDTAEQIRSYYTENANFVRLGLFVTIGAGALQVPFYALISVHLKRIEGDYPVLSNAQLILGGITAILVIVPMFFFVSLSYRPEVHAADTMLFFQDFSWLFFIGAYSVPVMQSIVIGVAVINDRREKPILPRWYAYYNFWTAILFLPGGLVIFFKDGPFAWNGVLAFWIPAVFFGGFFIITFVVMRTAIKDLEASAITEGADVATAA